MTYESYVTHMVFSKFSPRRPIKSFQDLEVYQKLLAVSVAVTKRIGRPGAEVESRSCRTSDSALNDGQYRHGLVSLALELPVKIARAHSVRFSDKERAIAILEDVMLGTNILIVYLEQYRDIDNSISAGQASATADATPAALPHEFFEEQIASLLTCRWKVMHLARSWEKFSQTTE